jgi:hypothetical protein
MLWKVARENHNPLVGGAPSVFRALMPRSLAPTGRRSGEDIAAQCVAHAATAACDYISGQRPVSVRFSVRQSNSLSTDLKIVDTLLNGLSGYCVDFHVILENHPGSEKIILCFRSDDDDPRC